MMEFPKLYNIERGREEGDGGGEVKGEAEPMG